MKNRLRIGVVGFSGAKFDEEVARQMVEEGLQSITGSYNYDEVEIVSGLTALGVPLMAYQWAKDRGIRTVGIACKKAVKYEQFPCDEVILEGDNWGDESPTFLNSIDVMLRVGGGKQAFAEAQAHIDAGKPITQYNLPAITV